MKHAFDGLTYFSTQNISSHLSILGLVAHEAMRLRVNGDVLVPSQRPITLIAAEVLQMPGLVLSTRVLCIKDELITSVASRDLGMGRVVSCAVNLPSLIVVKQINQDFLKEIYNPCLQTITEKHKIWT